MPKSYYQSFLCLPQMANNKNPSSKLKRCKNLRNMRASRKTLIVFVIEVLKQELDGDLVNIPGKDFQSLIVDGQST